MKTKTVNSSQKEKLVQPPNLQKQAKHRKEFSRREANLRMLPPIPEVRPKKKQYISKEVGLRGTSPVSQQHRKMLDGLTTGFDLNQKGRVDSSTSASVLDLNKKERMHANFTTPRNTRVAFDLNQGDVYSGKESCMPSRAPIFDLNEISVGNQVHNLIT